MYIYIHTIYIYIYIHTISSIHQYKNYAQLIFIKETLTFALSNVAKQHGATQKLVSEPPLVIDS